MSLRQEIIYQVLRAVSGQLNLHLLVQSAVETLAQITNYPHVCLALPDKNGTHWVVRGAAGSLADEIGATYPIHQGVIGRALKTAQMQWVRDNLEDPSYVRSVSKADVQALRSEIVVLLKHEDRLLGALNIESDRVDAFDDKDVDLIQALAEVISLGVENAQLYQDAQQEITERMRAEEIIAASEQKLRTLFNIMAEGVALNEIIYNEKGEMIDYRIQEVNEAFYKMADYESGRVIGNVGTSVYGMAPEAIKGFLEGHKKTGQVANTEYVSPRTNRIYMISTSPFQNGRFVTSFYDITERKQAEIALLDSRALQNAIFNSTNDFIWSVDLERFGLLTFNRGLSDYFLKERGISIKIGDRPEELLPTTESITRWKAMYHQARSNGTYTIQYQVFSGTRILELTFNVLKREDKVFGISVFGKDITERKLAEEKLAQSNERFRQLFENSGTGIIVVDENGQYLLANKIAAASFGKSPEELAGKSIFDFLPHEVAKHYLEFNRQLIRTGGGREYEDTFQLPSGQRSFLIKDQCIQDESGRNFAIQSSSIEISERKQAEARLQESEGRYRDLVENSHELIYTHDLYGKLLSVNHTAALTLGYTATGLVGRNLVELLAPEQRPLFEGYLDKVRRKVSEAGTWVLQSVNGEKRLWEYTSMMRSEGKQGPYVRGMAHDITERTLAETALRDSEERFHKIFDEGSIGMVLTSRDMKFVSANPAFCQMLGYTKSEMNNKMFQNVSHPEHREQDRQNLEKMWRGKIPAYRTETRYITKNGEIRWGSLSTSLIRGQAGKLLFALAMIEDITERKQIEEALRLSETSLAEAQSIAQLGSWEYDTATNKTKWSMEMFRIFGKEPSLGEPSWQEHRASIHPEDWAVVDSAVQAAILEGTPYELEFRIIHPNGSTTWGWMIGKTTRDDTGKVVKLFGTVQDITERKQMDEVLRESETRYRAVFEGVQDAIFIESRDGRILDANRRACEMFGYSHAAFITKNVADLVPSKDYIVAFTPKDSPSLPIHPIETINVRANGEQFPIELNVRVQTLNQEEVLFVVGRDITERKRVQELLRESEARFKLMFEQAPLAINITRGTNILYANPAYLELFGYSSLDTLQRLPPLELFTPEFRHVILENTQQRDQGQPVPNGYEAECIRKDGTRFPVLMDFSRTIFSDGPATVGFILDITNRKQAEAELAASHEQLRALSQYLEAAREEERTFIAREIHDELGQELTALKMDLAWLARQLLPEQAALVRKTTAMSDMVDGTIQTVRRVASQLRPGMLDDLGLVAALEWQAGEFQTRTGIHCKLALPEKVTTLSRDQATAMFRIFQETLTNIARHSQATKVRIALKEQPESIHLAVHDNGIGITRDQLADPRSLGLIGMRERVKTFGGAVEFKSAPGRGTSVRLRMPLVNMQAEKEA